jgi:pilus assembly protein CpaB
LVLLVGVFLAVIAFVGVLFLSGNQSTPGDGDEEPTTQNVVVATENIALGSVIDDTMVEVKEVEIAGAERDAFADVSQVIGQIARQEVLAGGQITARTTASNQTVVDLRVPPGMRAMTVEVDEVTGVGTLIKAGDFVDMVVRIKIEPVRDPERQPENVWDTSSKILLQGIQVLAVQLPPVAPAAAPADGEATADPGTGLSGRHELVTLALTPAQVEVVKWVQGTEPNSTWPTEDPSISLVLRSPSDFLDENGDPRLPESPCTTAPLPTESPAPASPEPGASPSPAPYRGCETTDGVVLSSLLQTYGVLHPAVADLEYYVSIIPQLLEIQEQLGLDLGVTASPAP